MYNILVCDDEKDIVSALTIYLTTAGYQVFPAYDGTEALDLLRREDIHLVLLDIMMPKLDGIAALTRLREASNVPVILLTAKSEDTDKIQGLNLGADDYVTKPFNPVEVLARVKSQLRRYLQLGGGTVRPTALRLGASPWMTGQRKSPWTATPCRSPPGSMTSCTCSWGPPAPCSLPSASTAPCGAKSRSGWRTPWPSTSVTSGKNWRSTPPTPVILR